MLTFEAVQAMGFVPTRVPTGSLPHVRLVVAVLRLMVCSFVRTSLLRMQGLIPSGGLYYRPCCVMPTVLARSSSDYAICS